MKLQQLISGKKAFLFDFDGVVTDSEPYAFMTLKAVMKDSFGIDIDDSDIWVTIGSDTAGTAMEMRRKYGVDLDGNKLIERLKAYPDFYTSYPLIKPFPFVEEVFSVLKEKGKKIAIVSSTSFGHLSAALQRMHLDSFIDVVISGDRVENKKPHPDPYIKAMEVLNASVSDSLAIEDSPVGIMSAKRAGLSVIAFKGSEVVQETKDSDVEIGSYREFLEAIK